MLSTHIFGCVHTIMKTTARCCSLHGVSMILSYPIVIVFVGVLQIIFNLFLLYQDELTRLWTVKLSLASNPIPLQLYAGSEKIHIWTPHGGLNLTNQKSWRKLNKHVTNDCPLH